MTTMTSKENTKPRNNLVAESDLQACTKSIGDCLDDPKFSLKDENGNSLLMQQAKSSLVGNMQRLVESMPDHLYNNHVERNVVQNDDDDEDSMDEDSMVEESTVVDDDEFDEDELVDQDVLKRARMLRNQVREASERVAKLRESVTDRAVSVAQREATLLVGPKTTTVVKEYNADEIAQTFQQQEEATAKNDSLVEMETSLKNLTTCLNEMATKLPDTMETLQETIDTIQAAMEQEEAGVQSLSQTERAIRSRSNEGPSQVSASQQEEKAAPEARLGSFLGQHGM